MSGMETSTEPGTLDDNFTSYRIKDYIVLVFYLITQFATTLVLIFLLLVLSRHMHSTMTNILVS